MQNFCLNYNLNTIAWQHHIQVTCCEIFPWSSNISQEATGHTHDGITVTFHCHSDQQVTIVLLSRNKIIWKKNVILKITSDDIQWQQNKTNDTDTVVRKVI